MKLIKFGRGKDKKKRKSRLLRNVLLGVGGAGLLGAGLYLGTRGKGKSISMGSSTTSITSQPKTVISKPAPRVNAYPVEPRPVETLSSNDYVDPFKEVKEKAKNIKPPKTKEQLAEEAREKVNRIVSLLDRGNLNTRYKSNQISGSPQYGSLGKLVNKGLSKKQVQSQLVKERRRKLLSFYGDDKLKPVGAIGQRSRSERQKIKKYIINQRKNNYNNRLDYNLGDMNLVKLIYLQS
jgi:hypothetical protein